jgi:hypothetical protein
MHFVRTIPNHCLLNNTLYDGASESAGYDSQQQTRSSGKNLQRPVSLICLNISEEASRNDYVQD